MPAAGATAPVTLPASPEMATMETMEASVLEVLTALLSLVSAVGVLVVNSKVDGLTGRVDALEGTLHMVVAVVMGRKPSSGGPS